MKREDLDGPEASPLGNVPPGAGEAPKSAAPVVVMISNLSRIAGLADGCADAIRLSMEVNREGVIRVLREIAALAGSLLPPRPSQNGERSEPPKDLDRFSSSTKSSPEAKP